MRYFIAFLLCIGLVNAADLPDELVCLNEENGEIVITIKDCPNKVFKDGGYFFYAYATEGNGTKHEGCWVSPIPEGAPRHPSIRVFRVVNTIWEEGDRATYPDYYFKERLKPNT